MNIPAIVADMIGKILNPKEPDHIRDNFRMTLVNIRDAADDAIHKYDVEKAMKPVAPKRKKK